MIPNPGRRGVERLVRLVDSVPAYWLDIGSDLRDIPRRVADVLGGAPS